MKFSNGQGPLGHAPEAEVALVYTVPETLNNLIHGVQLIRHCPAVGQEPVVALSRSKWDPIFLIFWAK